LVLPSNFFDVATKYYRLVIVDISIYISLNTD
jgi:hypothetical protein